MLQCLRSKLINLDNENDREKNFLAVTFIFDLISLQKGDTEVPQCVICYKTLRNDAMRLMFEKHLITAYSDLAEKPNKNLVLKSHFLKKVKFYMCGTFQQKFSNVFEASYEIFILMAKNKKSHSIGESLVKLSMLIAAELILGRDKANMLSQISLSNDTVKERIDEFPDQDIKDQLLD